MVKWPNLLIRRTIIYSTYILHVSDPEVGLIVVCSNPCLIMFESAKNCVNFTATNALTMTVFDFCIVVSQSCGVNELGIMKALVHIHVTNCFIDYMLAAFHSNKQKGMSIYC